MEPKFVTSHPAVLVGDTLVIADLHLGVEFDFYKSGIKIPSHMEGMRREIEALIGRTKAKRLVILGDVKHKVPGVTRQELREIPDFLYALGNKISVEVVHGNHDASLKEFVPANIRLHPGIGFSAKECYFTHGHAWPPADFLGKKYVFIGHEHPQIEFRDPLGYRYTEPVWMRMEFDREKLKKKYRKLPANLPELIVVPVFNRLSGGISMNMPVEKIDRYHGLSPLFRSAKMKTSKIYLLDGTFLGELKDLF